MGSALLNVFTSSKSNCCQATNGTLLALRTVAASLRAASGIAKCSLWVSVTPNKASTCNTHGKRCGPQCRSSKLRAVCRLVAADDRATPWSTLLTLAHLRLVRPLRKVREAVGVTSGQAQQRLQRIAEGIAVETIARLTLTTPGKRGAWRDIHAHSDRMAACDGRKSAVKVPLHWVHTGHPGR